MRSLVLALLAALVVPTAASAATADSVVRHSGINLGPTYMLHYAGEAGEDNSVFVDVSSTPRLEPSLDPSADLATVRETGAGANLTTRTCLALTAQEATCNSLLFEDADNGASGVSPQRWDLIFVAPGDGNDRITTRGSRPAYPLGYYGVELEGGSGEDVIDARNQLQEHIYCGPGSDVVTANTFDYVRDDCETVSLG